MKGRRRFYKTVSLSAERAILLDGRPVRTPVKAALVLPTMALARAVAEEWQAQGEKIDPASMPLTRLANTAIDRAMPDRARIVAEMLEFAGSDLVCYRAETPPELIERQALAWNPVLDWAAAELGAAFVATAGIMHRPQPEAALKAVEAHLEGLDPFVLTALHNLMTLSGSLMIAAMTVAERLEPERAWRAANTDEDFQIGQWGEDAGARLRRDVRRREFLACCRFASLAAPDRTEA
ncbi:MAG: ATP12 family chaperone protein [Hyphomicrobiales bacterium]